MILATWLVEFYLSKCNELDDLIASRTVSQDVENLEAERVMLEDDLRQFFVTYKVCHLPRRVPQELADTNQVNLNTKTMYELIQGHGRTDLYLYYASVINDFERVVEHWVLEEDWVKAIDVINRQVRPLVFLLAQADLLFRSQILSYTIGLGLCSCAMPRRKRSIHGYVVLNWILCVLFRPFYSFNTFPEIHYHLIMQ
jgi:hypothetical protein